MNTERLNKIRIGSKGQHFHFVEARKEEEDSYPVILIVSPYHRRVSLLLDRILKEHKKELSCTGVDLYRQALSQIKGSLSQRLVALIITDMPDDYKAAGTDNLSLWKGVISVGQQNYQEAFAKEIKEDIFPAALTVITVFQDRQGKLSEEEIASITEEFTTYMQVNSLRHILCPSESDLPDFVNREIVSSVIQRYRQSAPIRKFERTRVQKIAKAKKLTGDAHKKHTMAEG